MYVAMLAVLFVGLPAACQIGYRLGIRAGRRMDARDKSHAAAWQAALLGLAALLIGFTFSMAQARYDARKHIVLAEANDIGTTYRRPTCSTPRPRNELRALIRRYVDARLAFADPRGRGPETDAISCASSSELADQIWLRVAAAGAR